MILSLFPTLDFENPQRLNLYSYVLNNPLRTADPNGHTHQECGQQTTSTNANGDTVVNANCHDVPDWWNFETNFQNWHSKFVSDWNQRIAAHQPPPQQNNPLQALQDINNVRMGLVPAGGVGQNALKTLETIE
jgi:hypothetical protein